MQPAAGDTGDPGHSVLKEGCVCQRAQSLLLKPNTKHSPAFSQVPCVRVVCV